jgi:3-methyladenine DNA glycosylase Mpg
VIIGYSFNDEHINERLSRAVETVAKSLLGVSLFTVDQNGNKVGGRIVETEAYDQNDCAAHCYCPGGKRPLKMGQQKQCSSQAVMPTSIVLDPIGA